MEKRAQMKLSFGMIFSIILIIIFIAFAIYGIGKFLSLQKNIQTKKFVDDLQFDVDKAWRANEVSTPAEYLLPTNIISVCFEAEGDNMKLWKKDGGFGGAFNIQHLDSNEGIFNEKPSCVDAVGGKVKIKLSKDFGEALVTITAQ